MDAVKPFDKTIDKLPIWICGIAFILLKKSS